MAEASSTNNNHDENKEDVLVIGVVQCPLRPDEQDPLEATSKTVQLMKQATTSNQSKIDLFVLPELAPIGYSEDTFQRYLPNTRENQELHHKIHELVVDAAVELHAYICYGTIGVVCDTIAATFMEKQHFTIRQVVIDPTGTTVAMYDKMLLCDYGDCAETRFFTPGKELVSFSIHSFHIGILLCADMRNPIYGRTLAAKHKVDIILQAAAFSRDFSFRTWKSFRETRAVENSVYWVGVNYSGGNYGETSFTEPWVDEEHEPQVMRCESGVLVGIVKRKTLDHVRVTMPYYKLLCEE